MTTFIYRQGVLTADRLKLNNLPGVNSYYSTKEQKLTNIGWCAFALSGEEPDADRVSTSLKLITIDSASAVVVDACRTFYKEMTKNKDENKDVCFDTYYRLASLADALNGELVEYSLLNDGNNVANGMYMTNRDLYIFNYGGLARARKDTSHAHGAGKGVADILLSLNIPTNVIYRHLASTGVPTSKDYDAIEQKDVQALHPPLHNSDIYLTTLRLLAENRRANPEKERKDLTELLAFMFCMTRRPKVDGRRKKQQEGHMNHYDNDAIYKMLTGQCKDVDTYESAQRYVEGYLKVVGK